MVIQPGVEHVGFVSLSPEHTRVFGMRLAEAAAPGDLLLLRGPFGAGKTTLVQGIGIGLGVRAQVTSPSFTLINQYEGRLPLYHVDLFRLNQLDVEMEQAVEGCIGGSGVTVIEWPDLLPEDLRSGGLRIDMEMLGDDERSLVVHAAGTRWSPMDLVAMMESTLRSRSVGAV